jgi:excisionase family DNA binding protein
MLTDPMSELLTPKQVAQAIGVSESSLKRWCDRGLIETVKTPGGHRRMTAAGVMDFLRGRNQPLVRPELLGLPSNTGRTQRVLDRASDQFHSALAAGDEELCRQILLDLYLASHRLCEVFDLVFAPAYHRIGHRWQCREVEVYQERRGVEIGLRILGELRRLLPDLPSDAPSAFGGAWEGDPYQLPSALCELTLREAGWQATNLGSSLPASTLEAALAENRPRLFWLSVSALPDEDDFVEQLSRFSELAGASRTAVAVGGRALTESLRQRIGCSACCDNLQQLQSFAASLHPAANSQQDPRETNHERQDGPR